MHTPVGDSPSLCVVGQCHLYFSLSVTYWPPHSSLARTQGLVALSVLIAVYTCLQPISFSATYWATEPGCPQRLLMATSHSLRLFMPACSLLLHHTRAGSDCPHYLFAPIVSAESKNSTRLFNFAKNEDFVWRLSNGLEIDNRQ